MNKRMKRICILLFCLLFISLSSWSQGIKFESEGTTLEAAAAKAKGAGKLVFLDCFTQWCGPCKMMARDVFTTQLVGDFMNAGYVSLQIDMESEYGAPLAKKLQISAYPTFIIFNSEAQEIGRFLGSSTAEEFISKVRQNSLDKSSSIMDERWAQGDRDPGFLMTYLKSLNATYKTERAGEVADALLTGKAESFAADSVLRAVYMRNVNNPFSPAFIHTVRHPEALSSALGEEAVKMKTQSVLKNYQRMLITEHDGTATMDMQQFDAFVALLKGLKITPVDHYRLSTLISLAEKQKDWQQYMNYIQQYLAHPELDADDMTLAQWVKPFLEQSADPTLKAGARKMLEQRIADIDAGKRKPMTKVGNMLLSVNTRELLQRILTLALQQ